MIATAPASVSHCPHVTLATTDLAPACNCDCPRLQQPTNPNPTPPPSPPPRAWESEQEARKRERAEAAELLRHQREAQVEETRALRAAIRGMQLEEEKGLLASMAKEYRAERAKEMQRKQDARCV